MTGDALQGGRVVVVGGGVIGLSIAHHLAARGHPEVVVLDSGRVGEGATAYATGGIRHQFSANINVQLSLRAMPFWTHFESCTGHPLDLRRHGYLFLLPSPELLTEFARNAEQQHAAGVDVAVLTPSEIAGVFPGVRTDDLAGGTYSAMDASASPSDAVAGLAASARARGVGIRQHEAAVALGRHPDGRVRGVRTDRQFIEAERVVIATGPAAADTGARFGVQLPIRAHSRQAFAARPVPELRGGLPLTVDMASGAYLHPDRFGAAVIGGNDRDTSTAERPAVDWERLPALAQALDHRFPRLDLQVTRGWAGLREMTTDDLPLVGPIDRVPGLWVCAGFSGHGFMHAPAIGELLASWWIDGCPDLDLRPLRPSRFTDRGDRETEMAVF